VAHHQDPDRLITAHLHGAASRHAGWRRPEGPAREAAIAELRAIATITPAAPPGTFHPPKPVLRTDLLGEVAGILIGAAPDTHPEHNLIAADLLRDAGADEAAVQQSIPVGRARREDAGAPLSGPAAHQQVWTGKPGTAQTPRR
jgi:hypothetical protein